jgi:hypothetical protein
VKVTEIRRVRPVQGVSTIAGGGGGISGTGESGLFPPSGSIPVASGSNTWSWGSNVAIITSNGSNQLVGPFVNIASGTGIAFSAASNTLTITNTGVPGPPGSGGSSDPTIPSGGTLYNGTSTSGWTSLGSPDTFNADSTIAGHFYLQETTMGTGNTLGVYRAVGGSFPRTYTMKLSDSYFHANFHSPQIWIAEASPGKLVTWGAVHDGVNAYLQRSLWTNNTTVSTQTNLPGTQDAWMVPPMWLRLVVNSSTDIEGWHSFNGYIYYREFSAYNPSMTVGAFGFGMSAFATIEMKMAVDWIHET